MWWTIIPLTIISFVWFMGSGPARKGGGGAGGTYGTIYGHELTAEEVEQSQRNFYVFFLVNYGEWPDKNRNITPSQIEQQTYLNILLTQKAKSLGISVPDDVVADAASQMLRSSALARAVGTPNQAVPMEKFLEFLQKTKGFTAADFQESVRSQLVVEQLRLTLGLSGVLVTPQEAAALYDREHQEVSAQAVFFSATNYASQVGVSSAEVGQFFTNYMAYYRLPERVQVNYVWFNLTNFIEQARVEWAKTNLEQTVDGFYRQYGMTEDFKDAKTPEAAKAKIRDLLIQRRALNDAAVQAREFITPLFAMEPVNAENFLAVAKQKGLAAKTSAPFGANDQPVEFANAPSVVKSAFALDTNSPFSDLIAGEDGIYLIGLASQLPSTVPSFTEVSARVTKDYRSQMALALAHKAGTNFYANVSAQLAAGKSFAQAAVAQGHAPTALSPFSLSSSEVPEAAGHAEINELKQTAFGTAAGQLSHFTSSADGGFVLYVQKFEAADAAKKAAELPQIVSQIRRGRQNEAFNIWVNTEAARELRNIPALQQPTTAGQP